MKETDLTLLNSRQSEIFDTARADKMTVLIIGTGGIGSNAAMLLSSMGVSHLTLLDMGTVEPENVFPGNFSLEEVGVPKAEAVAASIGLAHDTGDITAIVGDLNEHVHSFRDDVDQKWDIILVCTDDLITRETSWAFLHGSCTYWFDARMGGTHAYMYAFDANDIDTCAKYEANFKKEVEPLPCGMKATAPITKGFLNLALGQAMYDVLHDREPMYITQYDLSNRVYVGAIT